MSNPLDEALNQDFVRIIEASPLLLEAFTGLPDEQRDAVLRNWNELQWQTILAAATPEGEDGYPKEIPLQAGFKYDMENHYGFVRLTRPFEKLHEYAIVPIYNSYNGEIVSYAISHRTRVFSSKLMKQVLDAEAKHSDTPAAE